MKYSFSSAFRDALIASVMTAIIVAPVFSLHLERAGMRTNIVPDWRWTIWACIAVTAGFGVIGMVEGRRVAAGADRFMVKLGVMPHGLSPLVGEMPGRAEGGALHRYQWPPGRYSRPFS